MNIQDAVLKDKFINLIKPYICDYECYLVGGYLRDLMSGEFSNDRDLIVKSAYAKEIAIKIAENTGAHFVTLDEENKIYRVVMADKTNYFDISAMLDDDLEKDIQRRDLTINAMVYDLNKNVLIDKCGALIDFENKILKTYDLKNFKADAVRILRVFRFLSKYDFDISEDVISFIKENASMLQIPAKERINTELMKLFEGKYSDKALVMMEKCGVLQEVFPVVNDIKKIPSNSHHHLDLLGHSIETVRQIQIHYEKLEIEKQRIMDDESLGSYSRRAFLKLAAFLHDIGKPDTWTIEEETGRHRFIMHDEVGAKKVIPILKKLKFSKKQISYVSNMIRFHIYPSSLVINEESGARARLKYFRKLNPYFLDNILLAKSDRLSALGPAITKDIVDKNLSALSKLQEECFEYGESVASPKPLLTGKDIMKITGLPQSKQLGDIVKALYTEQLDGNIVNKEEAVKFVSDFYKL